MVVPFTVKLKKDGTFTKASQNKILKVTHIATGFWWYDNIFPKHFKTPAKREYGYVGRQRATVIVTKIGTQQRIASYEDRKFFRKGHRRPLVSTGEMEREALSGARVRAVKPRSGGFRTTVTITIPRHTHGGPGQPDKVGEMKSISQADAVAMTKFMSETYVREIKNIRKRFNPG